MNWEKATNKVIKNVTSSLPKMLPEVLGAISIPFLARKKKTSIFPYVLGGVGVAIAGGLAAVMIMSPRTRTRALDAAKDGVSKVKGQIDDLHIAEKIGLNGHVKHANGLSPESTRNGYSTTGL